MNVYTEKTAPGEDAKPTEGSDPNAGNKSAADDKKATATPHTGDANMLIVAIAASLIAASALLASTLATKKRQESEHAGYERPSMITDGRFS